MLEGMSAGRGVAGEEMPSHERPHGHEKDTPGSALPEPRADRSEASPAARAQVTVELPGETP